MAMTPPATTVIDTPSTPRHGDTSRHYTTRKSARQYLARHSRNTQTPPLDAEDLPLTTSTSKLQDSSSTVVTPHSPPSSTNTSPRKTPARGKRTRRFGIMDDLRSTAHTEKVNNDGNPNLMASDLHPHALPTPASLPRKKDVSRQEVNAAARVLFPQRADSVEDAMPTPRKRKNRRHVGFSLYDEAEQEGQSSEEKIPIYTDSRDKVPEAGPHADNPFLGDPPAETAVEQAKPRGSRKRKQRHVETNPQIQEAFNREDGIVYVFRGRKIYRKFPESSDSESGSSLKAQDTNNTPHSTRLRPLTRSSVKPRLLFPTPQQQAERTAAELADEEATTEVEDNGATRKKDVTTPVKKSFQTATPPTTGHRTRSTAQPVDRVTVSPQDQDMDDGIQELPKRKKVSSFDGWSRTKPGSGGVRGRKREGEVMEKSDGESGKRVRSGASNSTSFS